MSGLGVRCRVKASHNGFIVSYDGFIVSYDGFQKATRRLFAPSY